MITPKRFYKKTSDDLGLPLELVEKANKFYWNKIRLLVRSCEYSGIYIKNIGTLYGSDIKNRKEAKRVIRNIRIIRAKEVKSEKDYTRLRLLGENLKALMVMRNNLAIQKINKTAQKWEWFRNT